MLLCKDYMPSKLRFHWSRPMPLLFSLTVAELVLWKLTVRVGLASCKAESGFYQAP